ncbi:L7Ae/L30e/S12e/Gadd45 family ribosomal protein [Haploplasma modicum]|jgi:ribosomal protein L7Ae-like RNA K-turn-binding protein|uniref:L7Ae/L30e/S12e/Gadd45 family ribosomal protein n=1 Tax=Haploplasma modicum TaxID=2150 RepID=UPI00047C3D42|nr:ribosomal L7Ae/L30e/S12e/Gadd45 family protein [Haploplasma modicum]MCR1808964.1 ribosomal L7Ae/L30e/S12e/Gadd45 family protein [Haploplasma modicum]
MINLLGLAARARKITSGTEITINGVRSKKVKLVLLATNASDNTKKLVYDKCKTYDTKVIELYDSIALSNAIGKNNIMVVGIIDIGFSNKMLKLEKEVN